MQRITIGLAGFLTLALTTGCLDPGQAGNLVPKTVEEDPSLPHLAFNDSNFHVQTFGDPINPVIIVLHGGPGADHRGLLHLREIVADRRLEDDHHVVFWDQRSSGLSQRHDADEITLKRYDEDLDWLVDHFSPQRPVVLIGHSWGGMYAAHYISNHPSKVAGAVLIEPGPMTGALFEEIKDRIIDFDFFSEWLNDFTWAQAVVSPDDHARADFLWLLGSLSSEAYPGYAVPKADIAEFWRSGAVANAAVQADGMSDGVGVWDFTTGLDKFERPTLFIASGNDTVLGQEFQQRQSRFFRDASLVVIADSGHLVPKTHPQETVGAIFNYLDAINF